MMTSAFLRAAVVAFALVLSGCAANQLHGYQHTYHAYNVPEPLMQSIQAKLRQHGLAGAAIKRDLVGRVQLVGTYANEDEVDRAFMIVQSVVGIKSTSPFYPAEVRFKRVEDEVRQQQVAALSEAERRAPARNIALVVGINTFKDHARISAVPGEDDARVVADVARRANYTVTALLGSNATKAAIEDALARIEKTLRPQDKLFIYISSHGTPPLPTSRGGDQRKMSIVAWDSRADGADKTEQHLNMQRTSVSDALVQRLARKESSNTRIFIDTCYSGDMLRGFPDQSGGYILASNGGQVERAGLPLQSWTGAAYTSKAIRFVDDAPAASAAAGPADIASERAYAIITATSEGEESLAPPGTYHFRLGDRELKGSFFTQSFFAFLQDEGGHVEPAFEKARKFTSDKAREVSGNRKDQVPRHFATESASRTRF